MSANPRPATRREGPGRADNVTASKNTVYNQLKIYMHIQDCLLFEIVVFMQVRV